MQRAVILVCITPMFWQPACAEEWFEKREATKCTGTVQACLPDLKSHGWGFAGQADEQHSRQQRLSETWAKGQQIIVCHWRQDGTDVVSCEMTTFAE
jgi:hypothetical protein